jgi:hypothetical protein
MIWRDNWIPRGKLKITGNPTKSRLRWVVDLIDQEINDWIVNLIRSTFYPHDAEEILKFRIPTILGEDTLSWHPNKYGVFSVKSAYHLALESNSKSP